MKHLVAPARMTDAEADELVGTQLTNRSFDVLFRESVRITREDGSLLAVFLKSYIPPDIAEVGYRVFRKLDDPISNGNRFTASIGGTVSAGRIKRDGTRTRTLRITPEMAKAAGMEGAHSGIAGYMDRYTRLPFCRKTAFNMNHPEHFEAAMPFIQKVNEAFKVHAPERYAAQLAVANRTSPDFVIPGTAYTTITVNRNFPTRTHKDAGDLKEGFGCMAVMRAGHYTGGFFVIPKYRVAFDCASGDVLLADVHEWHGNTRFGGTRGTFERISCVFYYREKMVHCGTAESELERAKNRKPGDKLWDST